MANNEDYLDSLLKAASAQDDPNSAINKVREFSKKEEEKASAVTDEPVIDDNLIFSEIDTVSDSEEIQVDEMISEEPILNDIIGEEPLLCEEIGEEPNLEEINIEETINEELILKEGFDEEPESTEIIGEEPALEKTVSEEKVSEETVSEETVTDEAVIEEAVTEETISEEAPLSSIDALLESDFSGEIELNDSDIASLLESAEEFAQSDSSEEAVKASETEIEKNDDEEQPVEGGDLQVDDILSGLDFGFEDSSESPIGDISADDVESLLNSFSSESTEENAGEIAVDISDIASLEGELGITDKNDILFDADLTDGSGELEEISSLLNTIDSNEVSEGNEDDLLNMLSEAVNKQEEEDSREALIRDREQAEKEFRKFKEDKEKQAEKDKKKANSLFSKLFKKKESEENTEGDDSEKKKSKFARIMDFLTASPEDEEEAEELLKVSDEGQDETGKDENFEDVPGENKEILDEMDAEGESKGKKKKKKDKKGKKGKKGEASEDGEDSEEDGSEEGEEGGKKKKAKKEKGERKPLILDIDTGKPLSKRNVKLIAVLAASLLVAIILVVMFIPKMITNAAARKAYYKGDYETTYNSFYGEKLNESDQIIFDRSFIVLKVTHKYDSAKSYMKMGMNVEALDQLLQAVDNYESWLILAEGCGAEDEYNEAYASILGLLSMTYGLTEEDAKAINLLPTDLEYSLKVYSVANKTEYIDPNAPLPGPFVPPTEENEVLPKLEDALSEEGL